MPVETLYNLKADAQLQAQVRKWYGPPSDKEIEGISLLELACILEEKGINENMFMIEQSLAFCDHDNLYKNLRRIGKEYLVPRCQNVLRLIRAFRIALRDFKLNRGLGSMHHILFPQDTELIRHAHNSRTDVEMTYKQAGADFAGTEKGDRPPGIQTYFKKGKDKWLINLPAIDATSGDLLLPQSFETIQDTQGSDNATNDISDADENDAVFDDTASLDSHFGEELKAALDENLDTSWDLYLDGCDDVASLDFAFEEEIGASSNNEAETPSDTQPNIFDCVAPKSSSLEKAAAKSINSQSQPLVRVLP